MIDQGFEFSTPQKMIMKKEKNNGDLVGQIDLEYKTFFEKVEDSNHIYPFRPMLWGKFDFEDALSSEWTDDMSLRICVEVGTGVGPDDYLQ